MTEAIFDFAAINRRLNRKPEPVAQAAALDVVPEYRFRQAVVDFWQNANSRNQCQQLQGVVDRAYSRQINALRASLDETETVFVDWNGECPSKT